MQSTNIEIEFNQLPPSVNTLYRKSKFGKIYKTLKANQFALMITELLKDKNITVSNNNIKLDIVFTVNSSRKHDLDNMLKAILDSLNKIVYKDDSQIIEILCKKEKGLMNKTKVIVTPITL